MLSEPWFTSPVPQILHETVIGLVAFDFGPTGYAAYREPRPMRQR